MYIQRLTSANNSTFSLRKIFLKRRISNSQNWAHGCKISTERRNPIKPIIHKVFLTLKSPGRRSAINWQAAVPDCQPIPNRDICV